MLRTDKLSFEDDLTVCIGDRSLRISGVAWILRGRAGEYSRYYCVGVRKDKKLIVVEQGQRGDAMVLSIYEHRRFENMFDDVVRHYPSDLLRNVAHRLGVKEVRGIDGKMHPVDQLLPNSAFV
jgi:hypothetical protein